jgi:hypothetical protein
MPIGNFEHAESFRSFFQRFFIAPVYVHLRQNKITTKKFIEILKEKGYEYTYDGIMHCYYGKNRSISRIKYFTNLYEALDLKLTDDEMIQAFNKMNEILAYKRAKGVTTINDADRAKLFPK